MKIEIIRCLSDNYSYLIFEEETNTVSIVDPSEFKACEKIIKNLADDKNSPLSAFAHLMLERIGELSGQPLPKDWDGVFTAKTK